MMMMLTAMRKDRIGWRDKSSLGPRGAKTPPLLSSQMAAQNQMALVAMMRTLMLLTNMIKECILFFENQAESGWQEGLFDVKVGDMEFSQQVDVEFWDWPQWSLTHSAFSSHHHGFFAYFCNKKIHQFVFYKHKQGNPPQTNLSIIIILNKIVILILIMDDLEFSLVEIGKSDPSLGASKNQLHHVGGQFSLHILQYQHYHIYVSEDNFLCMFPITTSSHIHLHWVQSIVGIAILKIWQLSDQHKGSWYFYEANLTKAMIDNTFWNVFGDGITTK